VINKEICLSIIDRDDVLDSPRGANIAMAAILAIALSVLAPVAAARNSGRWQDAPHHDWYSRVMRPDTPGSCCGEADAYEADKFEVYGDHYVAIITKGDGFVPDNEEWTKPAIPNGTRFVVPNEKIQRLPPNPTGHGIIFIAPSGEVICYCPPARMI